MDTIIIYEGSANNYIYTPPEWSAECPIGAFGHIIHTAADLQQMLELFNLAAKRNTGFFVSLMICMLQKLVYKKLMNYFSFINIPKNEFLSH